MKALFYLPVITDRHFDSVVLPLIRIVAREAETHVMGPVPWRMTGITEHLLRRCADMPAIRWHILSGEDHPLLRTSPAEPDALVDFVRQIGPDYTFCRSADVDTPSRFPGRTAFLMEPIVPPFALRTGAGGAVMLDGPRLYDQGVMPVLDEDSRASLDRLFAPHWQAAHSRHAGGVEARAAYLAEAGLPADRKIVALPLNVEAATNFFIAQHSATPSNARLISVLAGLMDEDFVLALTKHPLNTHGDPRIDRSAEAIEPIVRQFGDRVRIVDAAGPAGNATASLIQHCDGVVICDSKSFGYAAFFGKPILRLSHYASAPWMRAYTELQPFLDGIRDGKADAASPEDAMTWFGYHYANNVFTIHDRELTAAGLADRMDQPVNPDRWATGIGRLAA